MIFAVFCALSAPAQTKHQRYLEYIERYKDVALQHERQFGVPASITLAQGILESSVGESKMAREANNHFGIKAYHWDGEVYGGDSYRQVGYRKYSTPEDSFLDHAQFLKTSRYSVLYEFDVTDYRSWAQGLRDCGYAQDKDYPNKLINIIEQYELYALNGGKRLDSAPKSDKEEQVSDDEPSSTRWHHRKRRNRSRNRTVVEETPTQEHQQPFTPVLQGQVPASNDND